MLLTHCLLFNVVIIEVRVMCLVIVLLCSTCYAFCYAVLCYAFCYAVLCYAILLCSSLLFVKQNLRVLQPSRTGPHSAVGNMSGNRCESDCRTRGREFDPGPVSYFRGD